MRRLGSVVALVVAAAAGTLIGSDAARAHGGTRANGYVSSFSSLQPNVLGVFVNVFGPTNQLRLSNYSGKTIVVLGAQREPYLRFARTTVYENVASPTTYLNTSRKVPAFANSNAKPRWRRVAHSASYTWHDHRIVWTAAEPPRAVQQTPHEPHLVFNWRLPATADDRPFRIVGFLGWAPPPAKEDTSHWWILAAGVGGALAAVGLALRRKARRLA